MSGKLVEEVGDGKVWVSNHKNTPSGSRTVADRLRQKKKQGAIGPAEKASAKKASAEAKRAKKAPPRATRASAKSAARPTSRKK
ncbi:MAG: hypothetical protein ABR517_01335 [Thermoanaerobaculia bacterium]